jgi:Peptidogalycan biosysnthesis/recognition
LHFETCYWSAIEYCIKNGIERMEPGAGGGGMYGLVTFVVSFCLFVCVMYVFVPMTLQTIIQLLFLQYFFFKMCNLLQCVPL